MSALPRDIAETIANNAQAVDKGELGADYIIGLLAQQDLLGLGVPRGGQLLEPIRLIREIATLDLSAAFSLWAHSMVIEYLNLAGGEYAQEVLPGLKRGERPGVTGMASVFKEAAGCGEVELEAEPAEGGFVVSGTLRWASNLKPESLVITGAKLEGKPVVFAVDADAEGVSLGTPFGLLGLNATASTSLQFDQVFVPERQILSSDLASFAKGIRPTFVLLQTSECLGVAQSAAEQASKRLEGVNAVFAAEVEQVQADIAELIRVQEALAEKDAPQPVKLLELRLAAAQAAVNATQLEVRVAGGAGYAQHSPASRRFREAAFLPVQSPSEAQLKWELDQAKQAA
ncbi:acyl-CoA dehydrogenase family protein [Corynebacterium pelargi]|uniref:Acyl-CoA dehydrogenase n=1 Tax=Corynebacterium pelargi TaxID=1471400 RepID=A0A410W9A2_9CORY|nr:acyl-CoA dehydrogenase family protein [Corynebacterium pelargi]QAU52526.1 Acyl-CoA dehydrogenase [Corynebacterium pelargi]GGG77035.1 hypothetical protein GCM10007338_13540 [Corynebacterium pelargi]